MAVGGPESWGATQMRDLTADQPMHMRVIARRMMPFQENARIWQQKAHHIFQAHWRLALLIQKPSLPVDPMANNGIHATKASSDGFGPQPGQVGETTTTHLVQ